MKGLPITMPDNQGIKGRMPVDKYLQRTIDVALLVALAKREQRRAVFDRTQCGLELRAETYEPASYEAWHHSRHRD